MSTVISIPILPVSVPRLRQLSRERTMLIEKRSALLKSVDEIGRILREIERERADMERRIALGALLE